ncbi:hypothetical protein ACFQMA_05535 [Halosimplex aquaticum]|uniref:Tat (Twin-arginine translocation) pathway signal sequence n=1 Tax=Halosimplex aquaticum TaxID=3026162 RepID=A0ABD5Y1V2_9EURY|nr:hypothetical protein [Halosimplex aquaticum]
MTEREPAADDGGPGSVSRRDFLLTTGTVAGAGLSTAAVTGRGAAAPTVAASPAEHAAARDAVKRADAAVAVERAETTDGLERFAAGEVDALVGSRPMLPSERARVADEGVDYRGREIVSGAAVLRPPESSWVECLSPSGIAGTWAGDGPVETWAEVDSGVSRIAGALTRTVERGSEGPPGGEASSAPSADVLVRGSRAYQYAVGAGGVGYYEPGDWLVRTTAGDVDSATPVVRLAYLYADRDALSRSTVGEFARAYERRVAEGIGDVTYAERPFGPA